MRIISGKYRGMVLAQFNGAEIRPTADRVKESLFNILSDKIGGSRVLDLFCGSGNLGLECISRGAESVGFNDASRDSIAVLKKNLARIAEKNYSVTVCDYAACLARSVAFDIIFIDPPYRSDAGVRALEIIAKNRLLNAEGVAVYERDKSLCGTVDGLEMYDERKYGKTYLSFFKAVKQ